MAILLAYSFCFEFVRRSAAHNVFDTIEVPVIHFYRSPDISFNVSSAIGPANK